MASRATGIFTLMMWFFDPNIQPFAYILKRPGSFSLRRAGSRAKMASSKRMASASPFYPHHQQRKRNPTRHRHAGSGRSQEAWHRSEDRALRMGCLSEEFHQQGKLRRHGARMGSRPDYDQYQIWHSSQSNPEQLNVVNNPTSTNSSRRSARNTIETKSSLSRGSCKAPSMGTNPIFSSMFRRGHQSCGRTAIDPASDGQGGWINTPVEMTKAGWGYYMDWFYRPEFSCCQNKHGSLLSC